MKAVTFCCLLFLGAHSFAQVDPTYRVAYLEERGGEQRKMLARVEGEKVSIDQQVGDFNPPWFLQGLAPLKEVLTVQLEGLPPLPLHRTFVSPAKIERRGKNYLLYPVTYQMSAKQELIPLNAVETEQNQQLKPSGIESVQLEGKGRLMVLEKEGSIVFEEFVLTGEIIDGEGTKPWRIESARVNRW